MTSEQKILGLRPSELAATPEQRHRNEVIHKTLDDFRGTLQDNESFKYSLAARFLDPHTPNAGRTVGFRHNGTYYIAKFESSISEGKYRMELDISIDPDIRDGLRDRIKLGSTAFHPLDGTFSYLQDVSTDGKTETDTHPDVKHEADPFDKTITRAQEVIAALSTPRNTIKA